jgi:hypothetical protein
MYSVVTTLPFSAADLSVGSMYCNILAFGAKLLKTQHTGISNALQMQKSV